MTNIQNVSGVIIADQIDVAKIRLRSGKVGDTQQSFANAIGVPVKTLRNWEQHRRKPTGSALVLLSLIKRDARAVLNLLNGQQNTPLA